MKTFTDVYRAMSRIEKQKAAKRLKVTTATLSRWSTGDRSPSIMMGLKIERVLGVPIHSWAKVRKAG